MATLRSLTEKTSLSDNDELHIVQDSSGEDRKELYSDFKEDLLIQSTLDVNHNSYSTGDVSVRFKNVSGTVEYNSVGTFGSLWCVKVAHGIDEHTNITGVLFVIDNDYTNPTLGQNAGLVVDDTYIWLNLIWGSSTLQHANVNFTIFYEE